MRSLIIIFLLFALPLLSRAQLHVIYINEHISTHLITSEPIQYVDISTPILLETRPFIISCG
ncbi:MAG: hypothetical protein U5K79_13180 [Cyclobacteriaceae bacterium]|nr:hypothetical protein [Cyclobacteriaceae bacterium]